MNNLSPEGLNKLFVLGYNLNFMCYNCLLINFEFKHIYVTFES